jgi:hypothetical protein
MLKVVLVLALFITAVIGVVIGVVRSAEHTVGLKFAKCAYCERMVTFSERRKVCRCVCGVELRLIEGDEHEE